MIILWQKSRQAYFCCDKRRVLSRQTRACDKTFVATYTCGSSRHWWVSDSSTATDRLNTELVCSGQSSQRYTKRSRSYGRLKHAHAHHKRVRMRRTQTHARTHQSVVASIHYYNNIAPFCAKWLFFKTDGITCNNNHTHNNYPVAETGYWY